MNQPYAPGVWAERYDKLPAARKDAVNREADRIFAELTGVGGKLDPERDKELVRAWLRIRDAVMSGEAKAQWRVFFRLDGMRGFSKDPRHHGWFDVVRVGDSAGGPIPSIPTSSSGGGGPHPHPFQSLVLWFDEKQGIVPQLSPGSMRSSGVVEMSSPALVITWNLTTVLVRDIRIVEPHIRVELAYLGTKFAYD